ncbi:MAG: YcxB family protein [Treponema sp.]
MEFELKINLTKKDYAAFAREAILRRKINKVLAIAILLILTVHVGSAIYLRQPPAAIAQSFFPSALFIAFYFAYLYLLIPLLYMRAYKSDRIAQEEQTMRLKEAGIELTTASAHISYTLEDFYRVGFGKKIIAVYVSTQKAILIPRHCFTSAEEENAVTEFIKAHYMKGKKAKR